MYVFSPHRFQLFSPKRSKRGAGPGSDGSEAKAGPGIGVGKGASGAGGGVGGDGEGEEGESKDGQSGGGRGGRREVELVPGIVDMTDPVDDRVTICIGMVRYSVID